MTRTRTMRKTFRHRHPKPAVAIRELATLTLERPPRRRLLPGDLTGDAAAVARVRSTLTTPERGSETVQVSLPAGKRYAGASVVTTPRSSAGSVVWIEKQPAKGAIGQVVLVIGYAISPGGFLEFAVESYEEPDTPAPAAPAPTEYNVIFASDDDDAVEELAAAMDNRDPILFCIEGADAGKLLATGLFNPGEWKLEAGPAGIPRVRINPAWEIVAMIAIIAAMVVAVTLILALQTIILKGYEYGYRVHIEQLTLGSVTFGGTTLTFTLPTLVLRLEPPAT